MSVRVRPHSSVQTVGATKAWCATSTRRSTLAGRRCSCPSSTRPDWGCVATRVPRAPMGMSCDQAQARSGVRRQSSPYGGQRRRFACSRADGPHGPRSKAVSSLRSATALQRAFALRASLMLPSLPRTAPRPHSDGPRVGIGPGRRDPAPQSIGPRRSSNGFASAPESLSAQRLAALRRSWDCHS